MKDKFFLDTNILIYSFDGRFLEKQKIAQTLIRQALETGNGMISFQVMSEFINVCTKGKIKMTQKDLKQVIEQILEPLCIFFPDINFISETLKIQKNTNYSWYDCMIVSAAKNLGTKTLYSEDLHNKHIIDDLKIINPFK